MAVSLPPALRVVIFEPLHVCDTANEGLDRSSEATIEALAVGYLRGCPLHIHSASLTGLPRHYSGRNIAARSRWKSSKVRCAPHRATISNDLSYSASHGYKQSSYRVPLGSPVDKVVGVSSRAFRACSGLSLPNSAHDGIHARAKRLRSRTFRDCRLQTGTFSRSKQTRGSYHNTQLCLQISEDQEYNTSQPSATVYDQTSPRNRTKIESKHTLVAMYPRSPKPTQKIVDLRSASFEETVPRNESDGRCFDLANRTSSPPLVTHSTLFHDHGAKASFQSQPYHDHSETHFRAQPFRHSARDVLDLRNVCSGGDGSTQSFVELPCVDSTPATYLSESIQQYSIQGSPIGMVGIGHLTLANDTVGRVNPTQNPPRNFCSPFNPEDGDYNHQVAVSVDVDVRDGISSAVPAEQLNLVRTLADPPAGSASMNTILNDADMFLASWNKDLSFTLA